MINDNIREFREKLGLSQRELGRRINKTGQLISLIEQGKNNPSIDTLNKLAIALEVTLNDLIKDTSVINLNTADEDTKDTYLTFLAFSDNLRPLAEIIMKCGYTVYKDTNTDEMAIFKNDNHISTVPENDFVKLGEDILKYIQEFTEFEVDKLVDTYSILG